MSSWNERRNISAQLVDDMGWKPDPDFPRLIMYHGPLTWQIISGDGSSVLTDRKEMYSIRFDPKVPVKVILGAIYDAMEYADERSRTCPPNKESHSPN